MSFLNSRIFLALIGIFSGILIFEEMVVGAAMFIAVGVGTWAAFRKRKKENRRQSKGEYFLLMADYKIIIPSPKENRWNFWRMAFWYSSKVFLRPAKAEMSIRRLERGTWKLVISPSTILNL